MTLPGYGNYKMFQSQLSKRSLVLSIHTVFNVIMISCTVSNTLW